MSESQKRRVFPMSRLSTALLLIGAILFVPYVVDMVWRTPFDGAFAVWAGPLGTFVMLLSIIAEHTHNVTHGEHLEHVEKAIRVWKTFSRLFLAGLLIANLFLVAGASSSAGAIGAIGFFLPLYVVFGGASKWLAWQMERHALSNKHRGIARAGAH